MVKKHTDEKKILQLIKNNCPHLWSLLNTKAQNSLPRGYIDFITNGDIQEGVILLNQVDKRITVLIKKLTKREVGNHYRRDLSGAESESKLAEIFCEIVLATSLSELSTKPPELHPKNHSGKRCDVKVSLNGYDVYCESKRLEDRWSGGKRSFTKSAGDIKPEDAVRPRSMDLYSKLKDAPSQFPQNSINIVFVFHPSFWNSSQYIQQALLGDNASFENHESACANEDGLYALKEWKNISGCCYSCIKDNGILSILNIYKNPNANAQIPEQVSKLFKNAK